MNGQLRLVCWAPVLGAGSLLLLLLLPSCTSGEGLDESASFPEAALVSQPSDDGALLISVRTAPAQPPPRGTCRVELEFADAEGAPVDGLSIDVVPWMPAMGHGTSARPEVEPEGGGRYLVRNVNLFMPGDWELRLTFDGPRSGHAAPSFTVH